MSRGRKPVPSMLWVNPYCFYCGKRVYKARSHVTAHHNGPALGTAEHIPPIWIARISGIRPVVVLSCWPCNNAKNEEVRAMFPRYLVQLWTGGSLPRERMLTR